MPIRTQISISGFTKEAADAGLADLREELHARPWLLSVDANWDSVRGRIVIVVERDGEDPEIQGGDGGATYDEVSDCVWACYTFPEDGIEFHVDESRTLPAA